MHLKGKEKHFWRSEFNIGSLSEIPEELNSYRAIDTELDDDFLKIMISRIPIIHKLYFKFNNITDQGVEYISKIKGLYELTLREHEGITAKSVPLINQLHELTYLDIIKTGITLEDLPGLSQLQKLKELYVSSENEDEEYLLHHAVIMKHIIPSCVLYINYEKFE